MEKTRRERKGKKRKRKGKTDKGGVKIPSSQDVG